MKQHLRQYSKPALAWRQYISLWREQGYDVAEDILPQGNLFFFRADSGWQGCIDPDEWLTNTMPQSAGLASAAWSAQEIAQLFTQCHMPLEQLPRELTYKYLKSTAPSPKPAVPAVSVVTPQGRLWLITTPEKRAAPGPAGNININILPITVRLNIGHSFITSGLLRKINVGDVLLINDLRNGFICENATVGSFYKTEEGYMYEENDENFLEEMHEIQTEDGAEEDTPELLPRDKVKVRIGFVLQQYRLTLGEVESLFQGQILPCKEDAEKNITITANGTAIARGELVWLEDRAGIEIMQIYPEAAKDAKQ